MKKLVIQKVSDIITEEVLGDIQERILTIDPDSVDSIIQKAIDEMETQVYEKILGKINIELEAHHDHLDRWW
jgi:hypothetical protein